MHYPNGGIRIVEDVLIRCAASPLEHFSLPIVTQFILYKPALEVCEVCLKEV